MESSGMKKTSVGGTESVRKKNGMKLGMRWGRELTGNWESSCSMCPSRPTLHPSPPYPIP